MKKLILMFSFMFLVAQAPHAFACGGDDAPDAAHLEKKAEALKKAAECVKGAATEDAKKQCMAPLHEGCEKCQGKAHGKKKACGMKEHDKKGGHKAEPKDDKEDHKEDHKDEHKD